MPGQITQIKQLVLGKNRVPAAIVRHNSRTLIHDLSTYRTIIADGKYFSSAVNCVHRTFDRLASWIPKGHHMFEKQFNDFLRVFKIKGRFKASLEFKAGTGTVRKTELPANLQRSVSCWHGSSSWHKWTHTRQLRCRRLPGQAASPVLWTHPIDPLPHWQPQHHPNYATAINFKQYLFSHTYVYPPVQALVVICLSLNINLYIIYRSVSPAGSRLPVVRWLAVAWNATGEFTHGMSVNYNWWSVFLFFWNWKLS